MFGKLTSRLPILADAQLDLADILDDSQLSLRSESPQERGHPPQDVFSKLLPWASLAELFDPDCYELLDQAKSYRLYKHTTSPGMRVVFPECSCSAVTLWKVLAQEPSSINSCILSFELSSFLRSDNCSIIYQVLKLGPAPIKKRDCLMIRHVA